MRKKLLASILALSMVASMALAGCGGSKEAQTIDDIKTEDTKVETTTEEPVADATVAQELTFVLSNEPDGIDPTVTNNSFAVPFLCNCFEGLVTYDSNGEIVAGSAETWESNDDMTVYTFHLRDGLKWSDGSDLTAKDFVYSALRVLTPATTAQYLNMYTDYIVGAQDFYEGNASADAVGIKALDDKTLEFTLVQPCSYFVDLVSMWAFDPVQEATVEANGDKWTTSPDTYVCNGPFKISEMNQGESVVLVKNENYWDAANVTLEKIKFRYITDTSTALTAYENNEVDGARSIPSSDIARLKAENAGVKTVSNYGTVFYDFNCAKAPYDNPLVRKALSLAVDRRELIDNVAQVDGEPAYSFIAKGYVLNGKDVLDGASTYDLKENADVEAAKAALSEAGYPDGKGLPAIELSYYSDDNVKKIAEAIAEMWEKNLGVEVNITSADWSVFYDAVQSGDYGVAAMGWSADYHNPMTFLPLAYTDDVCNTFFYSNKDYDATVDAIKTEQDSTKLTELIVKADSIASGEYCCLPLYYKANTYLLKDYVKGVYMTTDGYYYFKEASVAAH